MDDYSTNPASTLAPEIIDHILGLLIEPYRRQEQRNFFDKRSDQLVALEAASRISRVWLGPARRRMVERLVVRSASALARVEAWLVDTGLAEFVRHLRIQSIYTDRTMSPNVSMDELAEDDQLALADLVRFLEKTPRLRILDLRHVGFDGTGINDLVLDSGCFDLLSNLQTLMVASSTSLATHKLVRALVTHAPRLEALEMDHPETLSDPKHCGSNSYPPVDLPFLRSLTLKGAAPNPQPLSALLSPSTASGITTLNIKFTEEAFAFEEVLRQFPNTTRVVAEAPNLRVRTLLTQLPHLVETSWLGPEFTEWSRNFMPCVPDHIEALSFSSVQTALGNLVGWRRLNEWPSGLKRVTIIEKYFIQNNTPARLMLEALCKKEGLELMVVDHTPDSRDWYY